MPGLDDKKLVKKLKKPQAQPQSIEAEESVLGAILLKPSLINEVKEFIPKPDIFYFDTSRIIWNKMVSMSSAHEEIDIVTIRSKLSEKEKEKVSAYYLSGLSESMPTTANIAQYAKIVLEKFLQRELINATYEIQKSAFENTEEFESLISNNEFLEHAKVFNHFYGTSKQPIINSLEKGINVIFDIDWQGTKQIKEKNLKYKLITFFILPPSKKVLFERLSNRDMKDKVIVEDRMRQFNKDVLHWVGYDYVVINDSLENCYNEVNNLIKSEIDKTKNSYDVKSIKNHINQLIN